METLIKFAKTEKGRETYPKLLKAIQGINEMVGLHDVKDALSEDIKTIIAFDLLDKPERTSSIQTRSQTALTLAKKRGKKRKGNSVSKKETKRHKNVKEDDTEEEIEAVNSLHEFLSRIQEHGNEMVCESDDDSWSMDGLPEVKSIRNKRTQHLKLHTLILGSPGTGKTTLASKIAKVWEAIGLVNDKFHCITKGDLASKWQGASLETMRNMVEEYANGVIFIDEAYSMVSDSKDTYGNEMLHYIVHSMTDPNCNTTFIMAGYADMVKDKLFSANEGLSRRFHSVFVLQLPKPIEMTEIFYNLCKKQKGWKCVAPREALTQIFEKYRECFSNAGGDIEALVLCAYKAHVTRYFPSRMNLRVTLEDVKMGHHIFMRNKNKKKRNTHHHCLYS